MNNKMILGISALVLAGGAFLAPSVILAYQGDSTQKGPNCTDERHEEMEQALENNDYNAWTELMDGRGHVTEVITAENFSKFAEAHKLAEEGKFDEADAIREDLGLRTRGGERMGEGHMMGHGQRFER